MLEIVPVVDKLYIVVRDQNKSTTQPYTSDNQTKRNKSTLSSMSFLYRPRSIHVSPKQSPLPPAIENVPQKHARSRTISAMGARRIIRGVSSIFLSKKKTLSDLKLANSVHSTGYASSYSSSRESIDSDDDIRRPSGLGRAASIISNRSLPPSPSLGTSPCSSQDYQRMRALSSPNLF